MNKKCFYLLMLFVLPFSVITFSGNYKLTAAQDPFIVVLDAGHGGHDPGNLGNGYLEKNIALNIVLKVGEALKKHPDIKVIYTRKDDTFVDLYVRGEIANKANANLFVSVHCDSHTSEAHGAGTFVLGLHANKQNFDIAKKENSAIYLEDDYESRYAAYNINSPESIIGLTIMQEEFLDQSILLAKTMQDNFTGELKRKDRKVKQAGFIVLHQTFMPSVLVETGFLTYKPEGEYLNSTKGQADMGQAIADAIVDYKNNIGSVKSDQPSFVKTETEIKKEPVIKEVVKAEPKKEVVTVAPKVVPKKIEEPIKEIEPTIVKESEKPSVFFRVQIFASSKDLATTSPVFKGLKNISKESFNSVNRYLYGESTSLTNAESLKTEAISKGFKDAYIVAYKSGNRISVEEATKFVSQ
ncbi:N-acetylmuramoyl-L-alanine amidase [Cellulophaga baltica]|uniref:N-acetylmuramoyl-L-alanine amidase family protein n=1 Tax=Cellulophaga TaxID=104264 RepID=UPI001C06A31D|nr:MULTISPECIES: N-acetylmuramoyl-L-alanine amidase [Cellulophaga]MBU2996719.1 N-acetylmuramoyl-L-alanine amidase [Cellulophaga baltica]MDO6768113.1 N-acetylmuramoyl-L-alanine amidase [Cellulophaga sp. 1_MG-2023]